MESHILELILRLRKINCYAVTPKILFPSKGLITLNGIKIQDFDIHYLRSHFGVVSEKPVPFNCNYADNKEDGTDAMIEDAATKSNAISFIMGNQQTGKQEGNGFDRNVGVKGSHISGGQKQRVAIARTILRNPEVLLLDEATSALDRLNQSKVQAFLDSIMQGKTVISVAHRIQTIKNSDQMFVFEKGKIVESGDYNELVARQGYFYSLERGTQFT